MSARRGARDGQVLQVAVELRRAFLRAGTACQEADQNRMKNKANGPTTMGFHPRTYLNTTITIAIANAPHRDVCAINHTLGGAGRYLSDCMRYFYRIICSTMFYPFLCRFKQGDAPSDGTQGTGHVTIGIVRRAEPRHLDPTGWHPPQSHLLRRYDWIPI